MEFAEFMLFVESKVQVSTLGNYVIKITKW